MCFNFSKTEPDKVSFSLFRNSSPRSQSYAIPRKELPSENENELLDLKNCVKLFGSLDSKVKTGKSFETKFRDNIEAEQYQPNPQIQPLSEQDQIYLDNPILSYNHRTDEGKKWKINFAADLDLYLVDSIQLLAILLTFQNGYYPLTVKSTSGLKTAMNDYDALIFNQNMGQEMLQQHRNIDIIKYTQKVLSLVIQVLCQNKKKTQQERSNQTYPQISRIVLGQLHEQQNEELRKESEYLSRPQITRAIEKNDYDEEVNAIRSDIQQMWEDQYYEEQGYTISRQDRHNFQVQRSYQFDQFF